MDRNNRVEQIFHEVLGYADAERTNLLERLCGQDAALRGDVESLLKADADPKSLAPPSFAPGAGDQTILATSASIGEKAGDTVGHYKLLQVIGEGGFGVVFMAQQTEPVKRKVALKIIKVGMDTREVIARFEAAAQLRADRMAMHS